MRQSARFSSAAQTWQGVEKMDEVIRPDELRKATHEKEMERARQILEADQRRADERRQLQEAFMNRQIQADAKDRLHKALLVAAERGDNHLQVFTFPSELCTDGGRAINNGDPNWPDTLVGYAKRAHEFYKAELQPHGYWLRAEILNFPGGKPGDVAVTVAW
jgi:type II secretory pathway component PulJ